MEIIRNGHSEPPRDFDAFSGQARSDASRGGEAPKHPSAANQAGENIITSIKPAMRDQFRVNIFVDGKYSFSLDLSQLADYKLKVGKRLSPEKLEELISASNFGKLYTRTLEYVFSRPHSIKEVRDHLKRKQYTRSLQKKRYDEFQEKLKSDPDFREKVNKSRQNSRETRKKLRNTGPAYTVDEDGGYTFRDNTGPSYAANNENEYGAKRNSRFPSKPAAEISNQDIENVLARLEERGYLNDENFARYYVENRNVKKGISSKKLRLELKQKGISDQIIDQALAESPRSQSDEIKKIIEKKRRRGYDDQKLIRYLLRKGFDYELVRSLVSSEMD